MLNKRAPLTFTKEEVQNVIRKAKAYKFVGWDEINTLMLKYLGPMGVNYFTKELNIPLTTLYIPDIWKIERVNPKY